MAFFGGGASVANLVGATSSAAGVAGLVPAPEAGNNTRVLLSNATFRDPPLVPPYKVTSSVFLIPRLYATSASNVVMLSKIRYFHIGYLPSNGEINTLAFRLSAAPAASINAHLGIWNVGSDGIPSGYVGGTVIASGTTANTDVSASISPTISVNSGYYYFSFTSETNSLNVRGLSNNPAGEMYLGNFGSMAGSGRIFQYTATTYDQTTHNAFSFTTDTTPFVGVRYA